VAAVQAGYAVDGPVLDVGAFIVDGEPAPEAQVRIPIGMLNRHGLIAGATGTGKTRTLQVMAEQRSANGVPVFLADMKGDLTGPGAAGETSESSPPGPRESARTGSRPRSRWSSTPSAG